MRWFRGWDEAVVQNIYDLAYEAHVLEESSNQMLAKYLDELANDDANFERSDIQPVDDSIEMPVRYGYQEGLLCGMVGLLEPGVMVPEGKRRVQICTDNPGQKLSQVRNGISHPTRSRAVRGMLLAQHTGRRNQGPSVPSVRSRAGCHRSCSIHGSRS